MSKKQPNALRLADLLDKIPPYGHTPTDTAAAAELRRQHALLEEMAGALRRMDIAFDWFAGRGPQTQSTELKGFMHSQRVREEAFLAHDGIRTVLAKWEASA